MAILLNRYKRLKLNRMKTLMSNICLETDAYCCLQHNPFTVNGFYSVVEIAGFETTVKRFDTKEAATDYYNLLTKDYK